MQGVSFGAEGGTGRSPLLQSWQPEALAVLAARPAQPVGNKLLRRKTPTDMQHKIPVNRALWYRELPQSPQIHLKQQPAVLPAVAAEQLLQQQPPFVVPQLVLC